MQCWACWGAIPRPLLQQALPSLPRYARALPLWSLGGWGEHGPTSTDGPNPCVRPSLVSPHLEDPLSLETPTCQLFLPNRAPPGSRTYPWRAPL